MQEPKDRTASIFVDEAGDPAFYGKGKKIIVGEEGCSRVLIVGFLETDDPQAIRDALAGLRADVANDKYLAQIPSIKKTVGSFHAKESRFLTHTQERRALPVPGPAASAHAPR